MKFLMVFVALAMAAEGKRMGLLMEDGTVLKYDSVIDTTANTKVLTFSKPHKPGMVTGIVFHDFNTRFLAFKLIEQGMCLVHTISDKTPIYLTPDLVKYPTPTHTTILQSTMPTDQVSNLAGPRIADFCTGYNAHLMVEGKPTGQSRRAEQADIFTIPCECDVFQVDQLPVN